MFYFIIPYYNSFDRLSVSLRSILSLKISIAYEIHVFNNGSTDFDIDAWDEFAFAGVIIHHYDRAVDMPKNWNRCVSFLKDKNDIIGWHMLHVGDKLNNSFSTALSYGLESPEASREMLICDSNLRRISNKKHLLGRNNFPNITQIIFIGKNSTFYFDEKYFPIFDVLTLGPIFESYRVRFLNVQIVVRSDGIDDLGTTVQWYPAAISALMCLKSLKLKRRSKFILACHLLRLSLGDFIRKNFFWSKPHE